MNPEERYKRLTKLDAWLLEWYEHQPVRFTIFCFGIGAFIGWLFFLVLDRLP